MSTQLTKNFSLEELTATNHKVNNIPNEEVKKHLKETAEMLQSLRDSYGKGIGISSGYRSDELNKVIKGSKTSAHCVGYAADTHPSDGVMVEYQRAVLEWAKTHKFDQIIIEYPKNFVAKWIHLGVKNRAGQQRRQILYTLDGVHYPKITTKFYL